MAVVDPSELPVGDTPPDKPTRARLGPKATPPPAPQAEGVEKSDASVPTASVPAMDEILRRLAEAEARAERAETMALAAREVSVLKPEDLPVDYDTEGLGAEDNIVIHFVNDGLTALGQVWYRGQDLEIAPGSPAYRETCDRNGKSWLALRGDPAAQEARWGREYFREGPWAGKSYVDAEGSFERLENVVPPTREELEKAAQAEAARRRAAPVVRTR